MLFFFCVLMLCLENCKLKLIIWVPWMWCYMKTSTICPQQIVETPEQRRRWISEGHRNYHWLCFGSTPQNRECINQYNYNTMAALNNRPRVQVNIMIKIIHSKKEPTCFKKQLVEGLTNIIWHILHHESQDLILLNPLPLQAGTSCAPNIRRFHRLTYLKQKVQLQWNLLVCPLT